MPTANKHHIEEFITSPSLNISDYRWFFENAFQGNLNESSIASILTVLRMRGEDEDLLFAGAQEMRDQSVCPDLNMDTFKLADNCGTGGDGLSTFNISTASAINAASLGIKVAKHGNRSVSSKCGSADLLFECGYPDGLSPSALQKMLQEQNFAFFFAPAFHPVMKYVMPVRKALGIRTVFNLLGPLANPLKPAIQLIGVSHKKYIAPMANALNRLGVESALVVHSRDGMDEISPCAITDGIKIQNGSLESMEIDPKQFKINGRPEELTGGDATYNSSLFEELLSGKKNTILDAVSLNSGALYHLCSPQSNLEDCVEKARENILSGVCRNDFQSIISTAKGLADE